MPLLLALASVVLPGANEVASSFVRRDVAVRLLEETLRGGGRPLQYVLDEDLVVGALKEVVDHRVLRYVGDAVPESLEPLEI